MKRFLISSLVVAASLAQVPFAQAIPWLGHNQATGALTIKNDTGMILAAVLVKSGSTPLGEFPTGANLTGTPLVIPGAQIDIGDLPYALTYLNFPVGDIFIGNVAALGTPGCGQDLTLEYYTSLTAPVQQGFSGCSLPEPGASSLVGLGVLGVATRRRKLRARSQLAIDP